MSETIRIDALAAVIDQTLEAYAGAVESAADRAVDRTAEQVNTEILRHITFRQHTGDYVKSFAFKRSRWSGYYAKIWHVKAPEYRKTHLLEDGHANPDGTRTRAYPHIRYGAELARRNLPENFAKEMDQIG